MKLNKAFKWGMVALIVISVAILVWGFIAGWPESVAGGADSSYFAVELLLKWAYVMIGVALACWVLIGLAISAINNPKSLIKIAVILAGAAVICLIAYLVSGGNPALGLLEQPDESTLKLTDTILNLTYFFGGAAIVAIIVGEIRMAVIDKKK